MAYCYQEGKSSGKSERLMRVKIIDQTIEKLKIVYKRKDRSLMELLNLT
jgi:hypothetical protein